MDTGKSALGLDGNVAAALGYPIGIIAIISLIMEKENRFVKFHALQSILLHVGMTVVGFGIWILIIIISIVLGVGAAAAGSSAASGLAGIFSLLAMLVGFAMFIAYVGGLIFGAVKAYQGEMLKLPIIGGMADKWVK